MKKNYRPKRVSLDDKMRKLWEYDIHAHEFIDTFSQYTKFTPISNMPHPRGINDFQNMFVSAAKQLGFIEFEGNNIEGNETFRWTRKKELTDEEKTQLYNKVGDMAIDELGLPRNK